MHLGHPSSLLLRRRHALHVYIESRTVAYFDCWWEINGAFASCAIGMMGLHVLDTSRIALLRPRPDKVLHVRC